MTERSDRAEPGHRLTRASRIALVVAGVVVLCTVGLCAAGLAIAPQLTDAAGCSTSRVPARSAVQDDPKQVREILPTLGEVPTAHWRWRETRPRTCPDLAPVDVVFEGFAVLPPDRVAAVQAGRDWEPAAPPDVPDELVPHAPPAPAWRRSPAFDAETRANVWLDPASATVYFSFLRG